jgi:hypothetical protein
MGKERAVRSSCGRFTVARAGHPAGRRAFLLDYAPSERDKYVRCGAQLFVLQKLAEGPERRALRNSR